MARVEGEFRWTLLPTLVSYYVFRLEKESSRQFPLRKEIHLRFGMPIDGVEMKIDRNFKEAFQIVFGEFNGKRGSNHHDRYVVEAFQEFPLYKLEDFYNQILQDDLTISSKTFLCEHAKNILQTLPKEKDLYIQKYFEQGLDITSILPDVTSNPVVINSSPFKDIDDEKFLDDLNDSPARKVLSAEELMFRANTKPGSLNANSKRWERDKEVSWTALSNADHQCELDRAHVTFLRAREKVNYMEPHHLIPMALQDSFQVSLDCVQNILSLCPNCHRAIHYSHKTERAELLRKAYELRKNHLEDARIQIDLVALKKLYRVQEV